MAKKIFQLGFSSEIKVPQLGSARNLHSSAWAGKFRLGLITIKKHTLQNIKLSVFHDSESLQQGLQKWKFF